MKISNADPVSINLRYYDTGHPCACGQERLLHTWTRLLIAGIDHNIRECRPAAPAAP